MTLTSHLWKSRKMVGKWLVVLPLLVDLNKVGSHPVTEEDSLRIPREFDLEDCCPCANPDNLSRFNNQDGPAGVIGGDKNCAGSGTDDAEASPSILRTALRSFQPFAKQSNQKAEPKPLLQPEVGLASSVLETLRQVTDEEYQDALARDAARSAVQLLEADVIPSLSDNIVETPKNIIRIFVNSKEDEMDDNLPEASHIQETRCIHSPMKNFEDLGQLRMSRPPTIIEVVNSPRKPLKKMNNRKMNDKKLFHRNPMGIDNTIGASNVQEHIVQPSIDSKSGGDLNSSLFSLNLLPQYLQMKKNKAISNIFGSRLGVDEIENRNEAKAGAKSSTTLPIMRQNNRPINNFKLGNKAKNQEFEERREKNYIPSFDIKNFFPSTTRLPPLKLNPIEGSLLRSKKPFGLQDLLKLKDIELIPPKDLINNKFNKDKSHFPNLKSQMPLTLKNVNRQTEKCDNEDMNQQPSNTGINNLVSSEVSDSFISPTNLEPSIDTNDNNLDGITSSKDSNNNGVTSNVETDDTMIIPNNCHNDEENIDHSEIFTHTKDSVHENINNDNSEPTDENLFANQNDSTRDQEQLHGINNLLNGDADADVYQLELVDDQNFTVKFDNNSEETTSNFDNSQNLSNIENNLINDNVADTSNQKFALIEESGKNLLQIPAIDCKVNPTQNKNEPAKEESNNIFLKNANPVTVLSHLVRENEVPRNSINLQQIKENDRLRAGSDLSNTDDYMRDASNEESNHSDQISFRDLQEMSDSILNQSIIDSDNESTENIQASNEITGDCLELSNNESILPETIAEENKIMGTEVANVLNLNVDTNEEQFDITDDDVEKMNSCLFTSDNIQGNNFKESSQNANNEMTASASEPDLNSFIQTNLKTSQPKTSVDKFVQGKFPNHSKKLNFLKDADDMTDNLFREKPTNVLENLKSKIENLFSTPEGTISSDISSPELDSINESSNIKPMIADFNGQSDIIDYQRSTFKIPEFGLNARKNKLSVPKSLEKMVSLQPAVNSRTNSFNPSTEDRRKFGKNDPYKPQILRDSSPMFLNSPFDLTRPYIDTIDPSSAINDFSNKLRSHTENTIQNVKETLESTFKEAQVASLNKPDKIEAQDILESISSRHDELNDKLQAIHSDFNDRLNSFHQSVLDRFNQPLPRILELEEDGTGIIQNLVPLNRLASLDVPKHFPKPKNIDSKNLRTASSRTLNIPKEIDSREKTFNLLKTSKITPSLRQGDGIVGKQQSIPNPISRKSNTRKPSIKLPTTTPKSSFLTKSRNFKATEVTSKPLTKSPINVLKSKIPLPIEGHKLKSRTHLHTAELRKIAKEQHEAPSQTSLSRIPLPNKSSIQLNKEEPMTSISTEETTTNSPQSKLRNILQRNKDLKSRSDAQKPLSKWPLSATNLMNSNRLKEGVREDGNLVRNNFDFQMDTTHSAAENMENIRLVEPLRENVPYKCKLICYKDR